MKKKNIIKQLVAIDKKIRKLPKAAGPKKQSLEAKNRFEAVYFSNKLEGNKLTREEAKEAIYF